MKLDVDARLLLVELHLYIDAFLLEILAVVDHGHFTLVFRRVLDDFGRSLFA